MKKITFLLLGMIMSLFSYAQQGLHAGFKITPASTWMFNQDDSDAGDVYDYRSSFGLSGGLSIDYHFIDNLGIGVELLFAQHNQRFESLNQEGKKSLKYFRLPLILNFNSSPESVVMFVGQIGPEFSFLRSAEHEFLGVEVDQESQYRSAYVGFVLGFGAGFNVTDFLQITTMLRLAGTPLNVEEDDAFYNGRAKTRNSYGGLEIGVKYILRTGK